jgi:hypothetical protein
MREARSLGPPMPSCMQLLRGAYPAGDVTGAMFEGNARGSANRLHVAAERMVLEIGPPTPCRPHCTLMPAGSTRHTFSVSNTSR